MPAGQQLQELGMRLRCDDSGSEHVSKSKHPPPSKKLSSSIKRKMCSLFNFATAISDHRSTCLIRETKLNPKLLDDFRKQQKFISIVNITLFG